jgi:uncharacterized protein (DUF608 family)
MKSSRRGFVALTGTGLAGLALDRSAFAHAVAGPFQRTDFERLVPADKRLSAEWLASLRARGTPEIFRGADLARIGMPVGGICAGTLYLGGDGRLWLWDIFNGNQEGIQPKTIEFRGAKLRSRDGSAYVDPPEAFSPVDQGFALRIRTSGGTSVKRLDRRGFPDVTFRGDYPVGHVEYRDPSCPIVASLDAYSPFVPLDAEESGLPATLLRVTLTNTTNVSTHVELVGWLANAVCLTSRVGRRQSTVERRETFTAIVHSVTDADATLPDVGTMALALLGSAAGDVVQISDPALEGVPSLARPLVLAPSASVTVTFVVTWHFPNLSLKGVSDSGRSYAGRFGSAADVAWYVALHEARLTEQTFRWRETWLDSTLPYWFLTRTFANVSTLATTTCHRFRSGRFYAWEGVGCCAGTCTHVWHYAQAVARLFPALERDLRERTDYGLAFGADSGLIRYRGDSGGLAVDGQAGCILRAYREHLASADGRFLDRLWPRVRQSLEYLIGLDTNGDGIIDGAQPNTLDAAWFGRIPWISSMYLAALRAGQAMAREQGDVAFADRCGTLVERGVRALDAATWRADCGYYVQRPDPDHADAVGSYGGCHIDQVLGQSWAFQVGLDRVTDTEHCRAALRALWRYNFTPDVGAFRAVQTGGRWYAMPGEGGLLMVTHPFGPGREFAGTEDAWTAGYFNECMSGFEYQVAAHMLWEGLVDEGLAITRMIHDRYHPSRRNPFNEVECSDHYARAMASYGVFLAACGFEYHGPSGHIGFAPKLTPDDFRAPFTAAEGWGTFAQARREAGMSASLLVRGGRLRIRTMSLEDRVDEPPPTRVEVVLDGRALPAELSVRRRRLTVTLGMDVHVEAGHTLAVILR